MLQHFRLPDVGEGLTEAELVTWLVQPGQEVAVNDVLCEIETAKSIVELPSPYAGRVVELLVAQGAVGTVGAPLISIEDGAPAAQTSAPDGAIDFDPSNPAAGRPEGTLVGYGPQSDERVPEPSEPSEPSVPSGEQATGASAKAAPRTRRLAGEKGVPWRGLPPGGVHGQVRLDDVLAADPATEASVEVGNQGRQQRLTSVQRAMSASMTTSAFTVPQVTIWRQVDVTRSRRLLRRRTDSASMLALTVLAVRRGLREHPALAASLEGDVVRFAADLDLSIAVATSRGLLVPVLRDAEGATLAETVVALRELVERARSGRLPPQESEGGVFAISNIGVFDVDGGTPLVVPGQAGILALGRVCRQPWVHRGNVRARWVATVSLSFDHRFIDGAQGAAFLTLVASALEDPATLL